MRREHYARTESFDTRARPRARARSTQRKKISRAGPHSQSAILSAKPALLTNHQQGKISSVRAEFKVFRGQINPLSRSFRASSMSLNTTPLAALVLAIERIAIYSLII